MDPRRRHTEAELVRIIELADAYAREERDLTRDDVKEICVAVGIEETSLSLSLEAANAPGVRSQSGKLVMQSRPGLLAVHSAAVRFRDPFLTQMGPIGIAGVIVGAGLYAMTGSLLALGGVAAWCGVPAVHLIRQAGRAQFLVGVPNQIIVGWRAPGGRVHVKRLATSGVTAKVRNVSADEDGDSTVDPAATFHLMLRDIHGNSATAFVGLPRADLEAIADTLQAWQEAELARR